jgi:hypothetical protein
MFEVFVDLKKIDNGELSKHIPVDFTLYSVGIPSNDGTNYPKNFFRVNLFTKEYYQRSTELKNSIDGLVKNQIILTDTTEKPLLVLNGKPMPKLTIQELNNLISPEHIKVMSVLAGNSATDKYGSDAKNGAIEISTEYKVGDVTVKEIVLEPRQDTVKPSNPDNVIFVKVEVEPAFKGGYQVWQKYLDRNLNKDLPAKNGAPNGAYTVVIQFIVDRDGKISDVKALTNHGYGMEEEAMRMIKKGPDWVPAIQNGRNVNAYKKQPITFVIGERRTSDINKIELPLYAYLINPEENPGATINLIDLKKVKQLKLQKTGSVQNYELMGFRISIDKPDPGKFFKEFVIKGNNFSDELLKSINDMDSEIYIAIDNIDVKIDGKQRRLAPRLYRVVSITTAPD